MIHNTLTRGTASILQEVSNEQVPRVQRSEPTWSNSEWSR